MIAKKVLFCIGIILGCVPSLFGENENIASRKIHNAPESSKNSFARAEVAGDIERPLLRPILAEKNGAAVKDGEAAESVSNSTAEQCIENIMSILQEERKKLQELENEYKRLKNDGAINSETDVKRENEPIVSSAGDVRGNDRLQFNGKSPISGTSSALNNIYSLKDAGMRNGSPSDQISAIKDTKKAEAVLSDDVNQQLSKAIGNLSRIDLAECLYKLCEYDKALQMYKLLTPDDIPMDQYLWVQYQIANCYRNMKEFDSAFSEYQRFINQYPGSDLVDQAKWYIEDIAWWKSWYEKNSLVRNQLLASSVSHESK